MKKTIKANILLVEDDPNLSLVLQDYLEMLGYHTELAQDGEAGFHLFKSNLYNLCILDVMMPKLDGFSLAEKIRNKDQKIPIIFLTAKSLKEDRIKGFQKGCDDYITKPFSTEELSLRIEAILRRCMQSDISGEVTFDIGKYHFDYSNMVLYLGKEQQKLTKKEAELLRLLCLNKNKLLKVGININHLII